MACKLPQSAQVSGIWGLAESQHGVVSRGQLSELGFSSSAIEHRIAGGRLHSTPHQGIYAIGRPQLTRGGRWMAAVLACGEGAMLSHRTAASLWEMMSGAQIAIEVSVPITSDPRRPGVVVHRRKGLAADLMRHDGVPVTSPACTLIDIAPRVGRDRLEAAVNAADKLGLIDPESLRSAVGEHPGRRGVAILRSVLDRQTFALTDSELERRFLGIVGSLSLPRPQTGTDLHGFKVDFWWPQLNLVVETDGLRYHRTAAQQARDRLRDQTHTAAGLVCLRFTHAQVRHQPALVRSTLRAVARRQADSAR